MDLKPIWCIVDKTVSYSTFSNGFFQSVKERKMLVLCSTCLSLTVFKFKLWFLYQAFGFFGISYIHIMIDCVAEAPCTQNFKLLFIDLFINNPDQSSRIPGSGF